ncbi:MAG: polysaccharide deacetylase [Chloroflexota bacterium]
MNPRARAQVRTAVRAVLGDRGRALVRRAELASGLRPRVNRQAAHTLPYPDGRRAAVVIVADFELAWAWRYARERSPLSLALKKAAQGRKNVGSLLNLCDQFGVPITWAVVGHLMLDHCLRVGGVAHPELPRLPFFTNERWAYGQGDWFDFDPALTDTTDPTWAAWYAPDLVRAIIDRPTRHELGCHSFSHIPFDEHLCPVDVVRGELQQCVALANQWGVELRSFVFPGNIPGHRASLREAGFTSYRTVAGTSELDVPRRDELGLWALPAGLCLDRAYTCWSAQEHFDSVRRYVDVAMETGLPCTLWFHPEMDRGEVEELFPMLFRYLSERRSDLWITTSSGLVQWLEGSDQPLALSGAARSA